MKFSRLIFSLGQLHNFKILKKIVLKEHEKTEYHCLYIR